MTPDAASVINISSYFANKMIPKRPSSLYSLSKGALNSLTKSLAFELGPRGIRVNAIAPGTVDTAMRRRTVDNLPEAAKAELQAYVERSYPLGRIGRPKISPASPSIWQATKRHGPAAAFLPSMAATPRAERSAAIAALPTRAKWRFMDLAGRAMLRRNNH